MKFNKLSVLSLLFCWALLSACGSSPAVDEQLNVIATTSIIADVAGEVGGEWITVESLLPIGADPHGFDPSPQDIVKVAEAELILVNGVGLEEFLQPLIESAEAEDRVVTVTDDTNFIEIGEPHGDQDDHQDDEDDHGNFDPHTWTDPNNILVWVGNIEKAFAELDPAHADDYAANAAAYRAELRDLDTWIWEQVEQIQEEQRILVTDHTSLAYFARQYGFEQAGAVIPGTSTLSEPTAKELAALEDTIDELDVWAVFVGNTVNPALAERVAEDTGIQLIFIYTGSLSQPGGEADSYLDYIRYNVRAIVDALTAN